MKTVFVLSGLIALLVLVAAGAGVFYDTPGSPIQYVTVRGEPAVYQGHGLYRYDPAWFAREGVVWDAINLFLGLPLFCAAIVMSQRRSLRGRLLLGGLLFYFFYVYLMAMAADAFNPLFLAYVAIFALSAVAFFLNLGGIDVARLPSQVSERFPRRVFIGFTFFVGGVLTVLWVGRIMPIMLTGQFPPDVAGAVTLQTQGIDLGIVVPLMLSAGILLWRRSAWCYLLASVSLGYGLMMCVTLPAFVVVPLIQDGKVNLFEASPLLIVSLAGFFLVWTFYRNVQEEQSAGGR